MNTIQIIEAQEMPVTILGLPEKITVDIYDNSMAPTANEGDMAQVNTTKGLETGDGIFLIRTAGGDEVVRRIQKLNNGDLKIIYDNQNIENEIVHRDQIQAIGRVEWIARKV